MTHFTETQRALLIQKFKQSGQSISAFSKAQSIGNGTLKSWLAKQREVQLSPFVPVTVAVSRPVHTSTDDERIEIVHSCGVKLSCTAQIPVQWVSDFFRRLG